MSRAAAAALAGGAPATALGGRTEVIVGVDLSLNPKPVYTLPTLSSVPLLFVQRTEISAFSSLRPEKRKGFPLSEVCLSFCKPGRLPRCYRCYWCQGLSQYAKIRKTDAKG